MGIWVPVIDKENLGGRDTGGRSGQARKRCQVKTSLGLIPMEPCRVILP